MNDLNTILSEKRVLDKYKSKREKISKENAKKVFNYYDKASSIISKGTSSKRLGKGSPKEVRMSNKFGGRIF